MRACACVRVCVCVCVCVLELSEKGVPEESLQPEKVFVPSNGLEMLMHQFSASLSTEPGRVRRRVEGSVLIKR